MCVFPPRSLFGGRALEVTQRPHVGTNTGRTSCSWVNGSWPPPIHAKLSGPPSMVSTVVHFSCGVRAGAGAAAASALQKKEKGRLGESFFPSFFSSPPLLPMSTLRPAPFDRSPRLLQHSIGNQQRTGNASSRVGLPAQFCPVSTHNTKTGPSFKVLLSQATLHPAKKKDFTRTHTIHNGSVSGNLDKRAGGTCGDMAQPRGS